MSCHPGATAYHRLEFLHPRFENKEPALEKLHLYFWAHACALSSAWHGFTSYSPYVLGHKEMLYPKFSNRTSCHLAVVEEGGVGKAVKGVVRTHNGFASVFVSTPLPLDIWK